MSDDPFDTREWHEYVRRVRDDLLPKLNASAYVVSLVPRGDFDVKFAVELGASIMLDKPIIAVVEPGTRVSRKLLSVADIVVEGNRNDPAEMSERIAEAMRRLSARTLP
jgi:hypothetical protein